MAKCFGKEASRCKANSKLPGKERNISRNSPFQTCFSQAELVWGIYGTSKLHDSSLRIGLSHWGQDWNYWSTSRLCLLGGAKAGQVRMPRFQDSRENSSADRSDTTKGQETNGTMSLHSCLKQQFICASYLPRQLACFKLCYLLSCYEMQSNKYFIYSSILWCGGYNKVIFSADKIVSSLYNFMLGLNVWVVHGEM